jgi:serine/threonine-protein kinase
MIGETIDGRYRCLRVLGQGGMGAVYEAEHTGTGRRVAVKVINSDMARKTEMVLRFHREARVAGSIETPHIVQVLDTGTDNATGTVYMVMEFLRGEDIQQLVRRVGKLPPLLALRLIGQACVGLSKAHAAAVIHRDIKPANLFLSMPEGRAVTVKVVDFGIAKIMVDLGSDDEPGLTRTGGLLGSPLYMSPEQAMGRKTIDQRADVWSLGVVLYEALAGRVPHLADSLGALIMAICSQPVPPLQGVAPWIPTEIAAIVHRALSPDLDLRYPSTTALLDAIQTITGNSLAVDASELVPLSAEEQASVAPRPLTLAGQVDLAPAGAAASITASGLGASRSGSTSPGEGPLSLSQDRLPPAPRGRSWLAPAIGAALFGAGGLAAYSLANRHVVVAPVSEPVVAASTVLVASAAPPPPAAIVVAPVSAAAEQSVQVAIEPVDATVEVDGRPTPVKNGFIEIVGVLGSAHHVRMIKNQRETSHEVAITSRGAVPPKLQADTGPSPVAGGSPAGRPSAGTTAKPAAKPRDQALDGKFE